MVVATSLAQSADVKVSVENLQVTYGNERVIHGIDLEVRANEIFGIIGPAGAGKTTFLRALNRMDELDDHMSMTGTVRFDGRDIMGFKNVYAFRRKIGVVFPLPVGLPLTVYENVAFAPRLAGITQKPELD
jgi:phosphate transport system ATP-binding protein